MIQITAGQDAINKAYDLGYKDAIERYVKQDLTLTDCISLVLLSEISPIGKNRTISPLDKERTLIQNSCVEYLMKSWKGLTKGQAWIIYISVKNDLQK